MILEIVVVIHFSPLLPPWFKPLKKPEKVPGLLPRNARHLNNAAQVFKHLHMALTSESQGESD
jgi:hypothetical protein